MPMDLDATIARNRETIRFNMDALREQHWRHIAAITDLRMALPGDADERLTVERLEEKIAELDAAEAL